MRTAHMREMSRIGLAHQQILARKIRLRGHADKAVRAPMTPCRRYEKLRNEPIPSSSPSPLRGKPVVSEGIRLNPTFGIFSEPQMKRFSRKRSHVLGVRRSADSFVR